MGTIYIGGYKSKSQGTSKWKLYTYLFLFCVIVGSALKMTGPLIVETWINQKGAASSGYTFSVRDVDWSLAKGEMILKDVKVFNAKTQTELVETPQLKFHLNWSDLLLSQEKNVFLYADKVDLTISKDFASEIERIQAAGKKQKDDLYLNSVAGQIGKLNIIEKKDDQSRTVLELKDVNLKVKEVTPQSINKNTEFTISSNVVEGGKLNLTGKTSVENGSTPWSIQGSMIDVSADIFNKMAGDKLPFSFKQPKLDAEISAYSENGKVSGEISPDIKILNLIDERPGIPTQTIARALSEELTFTLPFTLEDELTLEYSDTFRKLKNYRRYPAAATGPKSAVRASVTQTAKAKKSFSFWPF